MIRFRAEAEAGRREARAAAEALKRRLRHLLALDPDDAVSVSEIACGDPGCASGRETVALVMRRGERTRAARFPKPAAEIGGEAEIVAGLAAAGLLAEPPAVPSA
ncbi:MAG: hypothetical protein PGN34_22040 [Methylobacterium frigidaeris]